jgi:hypothetical protein
MTNKKENFPISYMFNWKLRERFIKGYIKTPFRTGGKGVNKTIFIRDRLLIARPSGH